MITYLKYIAPPIVLAVAAVSVLSQNGPGRGGPGGPGSQEREIVAQFDKDDDNRLNSDERKTAMAFLKEDAANGEGRGRRGPRGRGGEDAPPPSPGVKLAIADVKPASEEASLYDLKTLRTLFFEFDEANWEEQLMAFNNTDVELPAKLTVDGNAYEGIGVRVRGQSSSRVDAGLKRPLNISIDFTKEDQRLDGYKTLNLHNSNGDPSMIRGLLYLIIAREYIPSAKANLVRVVINGENWGIYQNAQQVNKEFVDEWFDTRKGARWKAPGSPRGQASLAYLGDDPEAYKEIYEIKSKDKKESWEALINLCKILTETPKDELKAALEPVFNVDGALKFLALENALINSDGYWTRTSDYYLYQDKKGKFHIIPHDVNETFTLPRGGGGPGRGRGPRNEGRRGGENERDGEERRGPGRGDRPGGERGPEIKGVELDPLVAAKDETKLLLFKLLAVKEWREQYLADVRDVAQTWLDWEKLGPIATDLHTLIAEEVKVGTRKLTSTEDFLNSVTQTEEVDPEGDQRRKSISIKKFASDRRDYLLNYKSSWKD